MESDQTVRLAGEPEEGAWTMEAGPSGEPAVLPLRTGETVIVGSGEGATMRIADATVSRRHCSVKLEAGRAVVCDLGSKNGVFVGGGRVECASIVAGAAVTIGRTVISFRCGPSVPVQEDLDATVPGLIAASLSMRHTLQQIKRLAAVRGAVLLCGETGSGKDVLARAIHWLGPRREGPFVPLNVGTLPRDLADSELFGHERGAYTGALGSRDGAFAEAHRGTLFLDEIAEFPVDLQVKLLRVLEDGEVRPLGSRSRRKVDVRVVSATWAPLDQRVAQGSFRHDLYQRLTVFVVRVPALRERRADLPELSRQFLAEMESEIGPRQLSSGALSRLAVHRWPGNVRELRNVLYRAALGCKGRVISAQDVAQSLLSASPARTVLSVEEAHALVQAHGGNVSAAARQAGVARSTFRGWIQDQEGALGDGSGRS